MSRSSKNGNAKSCTWEGITTCTTTVWGLTGWEAALQRRLWQSWWKIQQCALAARKANSLSLAESEKKWPPLCDPSPLLSTAEVTAEVLSPVLSSLLLLGNEYTEVCWAQGHEDDEGLGAFELHGEAERPRIVQPREDAQGHLIHVYKYLMSAEVKNMEIHSSQSGERPSGDGRGLK